MKWHCSVFDEISIVRNEVNFLLFQDAQQQFSVRQLLNKWLNNEQMEYPYFIFTIDQLDMPSTNLNTLVINSGELDFFKEKERVKQLQQFIKFEIENTEQLLQTYRQLRQQLELSFHQLTVSWQSYEIEFSLEDVTFEQIMRLATVHVSYENEEKLKVVDYRKFLLQISKRLNYNKRTSICFYHFPENELTRNEFFELLQQVDGEDCTIICITSNVSFLEAVPLRNIHLIKSTGARYDIEVLHDQIQLFADELRVTQMSISPEQLAKKLAIHDFFGDFTLLDERFREFLESEKY
ncbi:hypothetical protein [Caryophanon latum]|uniref:Uncharacterized protein n=1 Tax=Caryophanon latum TaxID=33977 RepID=A0A1C0YPA5_9BACL|nr:hypothetical protein [Caryophanon latum]OCS89020.1 hypothetical protein A6K76_13185 [Caryophanon latum]